MAAEQPPMAAETLAGLLQESLDGTGQSEMSDAIDYTEAEKTAMRHALEEFEGYSVSAEHADQIRRSVCSRALYQYAVDCMTAASPSHAAVEPSPTDMARMEAAVAAAAGSLEKAYQVYPFPFYLFDLAGLRELGGATHEALSLYERFLDELRTLQPDAITAGLLQERNLASDGRKAQERIAALRRGVHLPPTGSSKPWWKIR